jgi:hypothetical protein
MLEMQHHEGLNSNNASGRMTGIQIKMFPIQPQKKYRTIWNRAIQYDRWGAQKRIPGALVTFVPNYDTPEVPRERHRSAAAVVPGIPWRRFDFVSFEGHRLVRLTRRQPMQRIESPEVRIPMIGITTRKAKSQWRFGPFRARIRDDEP